MNEVATPGARRHEKYERLIAATRAIRPIPCAVAHPCDASSLGGAVEAAEAGIILPILVGPAHKVLAAAQAAGLDIAPFELVDVPHSHAAAAKAVELVRSGRAELLMKGSLHTDELMREVVAKERGLRTERRISHVFVMDVPSYPEPLFITDAAINIFPDLETKADICQNAIDLHLGLGLGTPRVAILSAVETVNPKIPATIDAAALCKMADRGQITGGLLDGPLALRQRDQPRGGRDQGHPLGGRRAGRHPGRAGPRGRQHAGQEPVVPRRGRRGRDRARRPRADHPDQPRGQRPDADGVLRGGGALRPPPRPDAPVAA